MKKIWESIERFFLLFLHTLSWMDANTKVKNIPEMLFYQHSLVVISCNQFCVCV